jgi:hypothetical protein
MEDMSKIGREEISAGMAGLRFGVPGPPKIKRDADCIDFFCCRFNLIVVAVSI